MSEQPWHKRYHSDALTGYARLSLELRGAYTTILDMLYDSGEEGIPDHPRLMSGMLDVGLRRWAIIRQELIDAGKIQIVGALITNSRYLRERAKREAISRKRAEAGREGGKAKANAKQMPADAEEGENQVQGVFDMRKEVENSEIRMVKPHSPLGENIGNGSENLDGDIANAKQTPSYTRATPETRDQSLTPSSSVTSGAAAPNDDDDDEKTTSFPTALVDRCNILARKSGLNLTIPKVMMSTTDTLKQWLEDGIDFAAVIVPTIERVTADNPTEQIYSLRYFDAAVRKAHALAGNGQHKAKAPPAPPKAPIAAEDGPEEIIGKFRARLAYAVGEARYRAKYEPTHVAMRIVDERFLEMIFRSPAEERVANMDTQAIEATASRLGLTLQTRSLKGLS